MGNSHSSSSLLPSGWNGLIPYWKTRKKHNVLILGVFASGKTSLLYGLQDSKVTTYIKTIGFTVEMLAFHGTEFLSWDIGGSDKLRVLWRYYYKETDGLIFMVDSSDHDRIDYARDYFQQISNEDLLQKCPILIFCNKQDLAHARSPSQIRDHFGLNEENRRVKAMGCVVTEQKGIGEGLKWLSDAIDTAKGKEEEEQEERPGKPNDEGNNKPFSSSLWPSGWNGLIPYWEAPKKHKVLIHGLDASGKTTLLYQLKRGEVVTTIPTIGFNVETLQFNGREFVAWDVGGRDKLRPLWHHYYKDTDGLIFMVDSRDHYRMAQARDELHRISNEELLQKHPILILCNKQDLPGAWSPSQICDFFGVNEDNGRVKVMGCVATEQEGGLEGLKWLAGAIDTAREKQKKDQKSDKQDNDDETIMTESEVEEPPMVDVEKQELSFGPTWSGANPTLQRFLPIQEGTSCPFAKAAKLWGGRSKTSSKAADIDLNTLVRSHAQALTEFVDQVRVSDENKLKAESLDGFCIELEDPRAKGPYPEGLGDCVREILTALSDLDPAKEHVMRVNYIGSRGWRFRFDRMDFFVTTFAPCYSKNSSRYAFGTGRAFILLQPEISFARHNLPPDTPHTEWDNPKTIRDKTRVAFRNAGKPYFIPDTTRYPAAEHMVKPLKDDGVEMVRWWQAING